MANKQVDIHRTALALVQASRAEDTAAVYAVLAMVPESEIREFLAALANMVHYAFDCYPAHGWEAFTESYAASLDQVESKLQGKTDT